jgi:hypothetical protein
VLWFGRHGDHTVALPANGALRWSSGSPVKPVAQPAS